MEVARREPGRPDDKAPRYIYLIVLVPAAVVEISVIGLLPLLGVTWLRDYYKVGGFLPGVLTAALLAWWCLRRWS